MNRSAPAVIAALLCLAACSAPAPVAQARNPFYLASPSLEASPNDAGPPRGGSLHTHNGIGPEGIGDEQNGGEPLPGSPNSLPNTPQGSPSYGPPANGSMSFGTGGGTGGG